MKRYKFRLGQVLRVRSIELDQAVGAITLARVQLADAQRHTIAMETAYEERATFAANSREDLQLVFEQGRLAADAVLRAHQAVAACEQNVALRLAEWSEADKKVRLLEELDVRSRERHAAEVLAEDQQSLDDLVTSRMGRAS